MKTQIFKEFNDNQWLGLITMKEMCLILAASDNQFLYNDDRANEYLAFELPLNREDADNLVNRLNEVSEDVGTWYVGAEDEEYVNVD